MNMLKLGDKGPDVVSWQQALAARGYPLTTDGTFGKRTHNATLAFQADVGLPTTGQVGLNELQVLAAPATSSIRPPPALPFSIPFLAAKFYNRASRSSVDLIVLHCMEAPESSTRAEQCAQYFATLPADTAKKKSAHYCVDSDSVVQCVPDHFVAYHAPGANHNGIGIEHAGYARQTPEEWLDPFGQRMLGLSVQLSARICQHWKIPALFVRAGDLKLRKRGITTHAEVTQAFGLSDHTDPGPGFPIAWYIDGVDALLREPQQGNV